MKKIVILGAGISGLSTAWFLQKKYGKRLDLTLIEKSSRVGGWIRTVQHKGFLFETGPRSFRTSGNGKATLALVHDLGLQEELVEADPGAKKRYLWLEGKLNLLTPFFLLKQGLASGILRDLVTGRTTLEDETIADFISRRFNKKLAAHLIDPVTKGIFGGDPNRLSMRNCFPFLWRMEQEKRSLVWGNLCRKKEPSFLYSFKGGMEVLPKTLAKQLDCPILLSTKVQALQEIDAHKIISCLPTSALAQLIGMKDPVEYATLSTVNFGWEGHILKKQGYGFLIPSNEKSSILGMTWDSAIFPAQNTRICVMISGSGSHEELLQVALQGLKTYMDITEKPETMHIAIAENAIPQYTPYHHQRIAHFKKQLPTNLYTLGTGFEGIGINDAVFQARSFAETFT